MNAAGIKPDDNGKAIRQNDVLSVHLDAGAWTLTFRKNGRFIHCSYSYNIRKNAASTASPIAVTM